MTFKTLLLGSSMPGMGRALDWYELPFVILLGPLAYFYALNNRTHFYYRTHDGRIVP